jgi:hypothetical protein
MITSVELDQQIDSTSETSDPIQAHIVEGNDRMPATGLILEAMVNGTPLTALCGHVWVPSRNPDNHSMCEKCMELYRTTVGFWSWT